MADIIKLANQYRAELLNNERKAAVRLVAAYGQVYSRLVRKLAVINQQIKDARDKGEIVNQSWLFRQKRYGDLLRQVDQEFKRFAETAEKTITNQQRRAVRAASTDAVSLIDAAAAEAGIAATFNRLPVAAFENLVGFLGNGSPLSALLDELPRNGRAIVEKGLIEGIALGRNPKAIARDIRAGLGGNLTRALTISRTEVLRAYRTASSQNYQANSDVVRGWYWRSSRSRRSCAACIAMDGTFHPVSEPMRSHPRCRCVQIPAVKTVTVDGGVDWFDKQPAAVQKDILATNIGYEKFKRGELKLEDFVGLQRSTQWGDSYYQLSVKRALAGEGQFPMGVKPPASLLPMSAEERRRMERALRQQMRFAPAGESLFTGEGAPGATTSIGALIRKQLEEIAANTEADIAILKRERDALHDRYLGSTSQRERKAVEKQIKALARRAQRLSDLQVEQERLAVSQPRKAKIKAKYLGVKKGDFDKFDRRRFQEGVETFAEMVGEGLLDGQAVSIKLARNGRAYYANNAIHMVSGDETQIAVHELGHWLEHNNQKIADRIQQFFKMRTAGDTPERLRDLTGINTYDPSEMSLRDKWLDPYMGKLGGRREGSEVLSMGLQWIYNNPLDVARRDPEFFDFIIDLVRMR